MPYISAHGQKPPGWCSSKFVPQYIFFTIVLAIAVLCLMDAKLVIKLFQDFIAWVKLHPYQSIGYSIYLICFSVIFSLPISYTIVMLSYTYASVFNSKIYGFLFSVPTVFIGCISGSIISFLLSRYLLKDFIREQIAHTTWLLHNFNMIDEIIATEGIIIVGLIRMTFAPYGITSYILGVSSISFFHYLIGNMSYILMTCSQCYIGCSLYNSINEYQ